MAIFSVDPEKHLLVNPLDNVVVALDKVDGSIPAGHKIARSAIAAGEPVVKYGDPIGTATADIQPGEWVHSHNMKTALSEKQTFTYQPDNRPMPDRKNLSDRTTFAGYDRPDGRAGTRNEIWIVPTVGCVNRTAEKLAEFGRRQLEVVNKETVSVDTVSAWTHAFGCSQLGDDHAMTRQILLDLVKHPNAGGVLVIGLGCENNQVDTFREMLGSYDENRVKFLVTQDASDEIAEGQKLISELIEMAGADRRTDCSLSKLIIGLKCGGSDAFSGLTANPLLGRFSEWLIQAGGSSILTEVPEMFGAEHILLNRATEKSVYDQLTDLLQDFRDYYTRYGQPVYENPSPGNKAGGITTLEEKSLGCTQKAGQSPVCDVLKYGDCVQKQGLTVLEGPGNDIVACTALAAAGAQIILFTTGRGTPLGGPVPTLKIASNRALAEYKSNWIDFDASPALAGEKAWSDVDKAFIELILKVADGTKLARNEENDYREIALFKQGVIL